MDSTTILVPGFDRERNEYLKLELSNIPNFDSGIVVHFKGFIDTQNSKFFEKQIQKIIDAGFTKIIFDCLELSYISSTGIGSISILVRQIKLVGGEILFMGVQPKVLEVFQMLGFTKFFTIVTSTEEAIVYFTNSATTTVSVFPCIVECPMCQKKLKATHSGKFRCSNCKVIIGVDDEGNISV